MASAWRLPGPGPGSSPMRTMAAGILGDEERLRGFLEVRDAVEHSAPERLAMHDRDPGLDLIHPGSARGREMEPEPRVVRQPVVDIRCLWER